MKILFSVCFSILSGFVLSQSETAIQLYDKEKYKEALEIWTSSLKEGAKGEDLYYNIANTHFKLNQFPQAILYYNKALKWNPNCRDCKKNLKLARKAADVESFELPEFILSKLYKSFLLSLQPIGWFCIGIVGLSCLLILIVLKIHAKGVSNKKSIIYILGIFSLMCFVFAFHRDKIKHERNNGILMERTFLRLSPDANSEIKQELIPGQNLQIKDRISGWIKVQTKEFDLGWIEENKLERIGL
jgi:tetratricopeptide (TPR) repeat protein